MDINKAVEFVERTGDRVLTKFAHYAVGRVSAAEVIKEASAYQLSDGGWTKTDKDFEAPVATISTTWVALQWFLWLNDHKSKELDATIRYLREVQREEGYWDEPTEILKYNPSPWMKPGRYENQLWLTAAVCAKLMELGLQPMVDIPKAISFLADGWEGNRFPGYNHTHWMALYIFHHQDEPQYKAISEGCKEFLTASLTNNMIDPGDCCTIAYHSQATGQFGQDLFKLAYNRMLSYQAADGGIITNYGEKHRAGFTVEELFLLKKLGVG